jgi:predicted anti-sigma-YlaC factor YlaD
MVPSDEPREDRIRAIVRDELRTAGRSLLGTVCWTLLAVVAALVGLQLIQLAAFTVSTVATVGFALVGLVVLGSSLSLRYLLRA